MATVTLDQTLETLKQDAIDYVKLQLGDGIIDLELDAEHYEAAYQRALGTYRQRAEHAFEESYNFLKLQDGVNVYTLPSEIQTVRQVLDAQLVGTMAEKAVPLNHSVQPRLTHTC